MRAARTRFLSPLLYMAKQNTSKTDSKTVAHDLFMRTDKSQKEIAQIVGVGADTVSDWARAGRWKELKAANSVTRNQVIANTLMQIKELQSEINLRDAGKRYPTPKESDTMIKLANLIRDLDKSLSLADYISIIEELLKFLHDVKPELAKALGPFTLEFAQIKARQINA